MVHIRPIFNEMTRGYVYQLYVPPANDSSPLLIFILAIRHSISKLSNLIIRCEKL